MRNVPYFLKSMKFAHPLKLTVLLMGTLSVLTIPAGETTAQTPYSSSTARARPAASSGGIFGALFGGARRSRIPKSGAGGTYNYYRTDNRPSEGYDGYRSSGYGTGYGRYRTLCVRSCDGYYWPMSYSTTRASFARDARQCRTSCAASAQLFVYPNPGADVQNMVDLKGKPYSQSQNAFRYRKEYVKDCRCKPEPWSTEAKQDYARRESGEAAPEQVKTAEAGENTAQAVVTPASGSYSERRISRARSQRVRRKKPRLYDAGRYDGQWWAGSW